jgi:hypothetical protein
MTVEIIHVSTPDEIAVVERLAQEIWPQHFTPIIGASFCPRLIVVGSTIW